MERSQEATLEEEAFVLVAQGGQGNVVQPNCLSLISNFSTLVSSTSVHAE
jgi:hypothetical protein